MTCSDRQFGRLGVAALLACLCAGVPAAQGEPLPAPAAAAASADAEDPFAKGTRYWSMTAGTSRRSSIGWIHMAHAGVTEYVKDDLALQYTGMVGYADAEQVESSPLGGVSVGLRLHFAKGNAWSLYGESLAGAVYHGHAITPESLRFNFDLQGGGGLSYQPGPRMLMLGGLRWHHLSNARIRGKDHNLGYDGLMPYFELERRF